MNGGASCSANSIMVYGAAREGQQKEKQKKSRSEKSGSKSRSVNGTGRKQAGSAGLGWSRRLGRQTRQRKSKLSNKQEEAKGKAQEV